MSDKKLFFRWISRQLPKEDSRRLVVLTGARQTGKTTLAKKLYPGLRYLNLDDFENREATRRTRAALWGRDVGAAVIDEAQKEASVFEKVKYAYDEGSISFSLLLGSAHILLLREVRESLAGRVFLFELWPLMVSESLITEDEVSPRVPLLSDLLECNHADDVFEGAPSVLFARDNAERQSAETHMLTWGGMPELQYLSDQDRKRWLDSYERTFLERDLGDLARLRDLQPFHTFQKLAALRSGRLLSYSELARDAAVSVDTARRYLEYLRLSYQIVLLQPYQVNITSSTVKSPKLYFIDPGILRQLSGAFGEPSGELFESYVVSEIYKWVKTNESSADLFFYRTRAGLEIDLLLKTARGIIGIEIKSSRRVNRADFRSLIAVANSVKDRWLGGVCVYRGDVIDKVAEPSIWAVPSYRLLT
jgi:predicted AAA+ superfamily ATPase